MTHKHLKSLFDACENCRHVTQGEMEKPSWARVKKAHQEGRLIADIRIGYIKVISNEYIDNFVLTK